MMQVHSIIIRLMAVLWCSATTLTAGESIQSKTYGVELAADKPEFAMFWVDSLGKERSRPNAMLTGGFKLSYRRQDENNWIRYHATRHPDVSLRFQFDDDHITVRSEALEAKAAEPFRLRFICSGPHPAYATLLGVINDDGSIRLPSVLHIPGQGSLRITGRSQGKEAMSLGYQASREEVLITFPAATPARSWVEFDIEVIRTHPDVPGIEDDARFDGFRRCWLNILQLSARHRTLANRAGSDVCALVYHAYGEIAMLTPALADGVSGPGLLRDSLDRFLAGKKAYGMPGYHPNNPRGYPHASLDTWPALLIAAHNYYQASGDQKWVRANMNRLIQWGHNALDRDIDGNGLIEFHQSGNLGECRFRPANWWDCINFGHEDAYSNALAYRAFRGLAKLAEVVKKDGEARKFNQAAEKLKASYHETFFNPETGMLAGWKSRDGSLHDYAFPFIQGLAITYGLIDDERKADALLDAMFKKMKEVEFDRFDLGLPGNLVNVPQEDYYEKDPRWGGSNAFQVYENGGASANHAYFVLAALYKLGRKEDGDRILFPILKSFDECRFQGAGLDGGLTNDWLDWDGNPHGYEGLLVDNYLVVKAVLVRQGLIDPEWGFWKNDQKHDKIMDDR